MSSKVVSLNIGGTIFLTFKSTLESKITLEYDENNSVFIDRNPRFFIYVLDYIRSDSFELPNDQETLRGIIKEADYFKLNALSEVALKKLYTCWFPDSVLNYDQKIDLVDLCGFQKHQRWELIYKASIHGFSSLNFHSKCDGHAGTLTIIKTTRSFVFGGFTNAQWSSHGGYKSDQNSFIFSLVNNEGPIVIPCTKQNCAIYCNIAYGPTFGDGHDIFIENNSNILGNSFANLGDSYKHPLFGLASLSAKTFLGGSEEFFTSEIEVYSNQ